MTTTPAGAVRRRILIVEDEPDIVRGLTDAIEFEGFEVTATGEGREGVRRMRDGGADLVILDLILPTAGDDSRVIYQCPR